MMHTFPFLAAAEAFDRQVKEATRTGRFDTRDALMALSISVAVGVLLFVWAYFRYRKKDGAEPRHHESPRREPDAADTPETEESTDESGRRRKRKRRRRRDHRPRNPSLQQTGGLPPPRPDDQLPKF